MENLIIVCDFDGTITKKDSLYHFFKEYAHNSWLEVEKLWEDGTISSKECLKRQFELVEGLSKDLIKEYLKTIEVDEYFFKFNEYRKQKGIDLVIVSDGVDYFINNILKRNNLSDIKVISNHFVFENNKMNLTFPNSNENCINNSATCKCAAIQNLRKNYKKVVYFGDGTSDFCISENLQKNDILFAKGSLLRHCEEKKINCREFQNFKDVLNSKII